MKFKARARGCVFHSILLNKEAWVPEMGNTINLAMRRDTQNFIGIYFSWQGQRVEFASLHWFKSCLPGTEFSCRGSGGYIT